jgi:hypothetical protein
MEELDNTPASFVTRNLLTDERKHLKKGALNDKLM